MEKVKYKITTTFANLEIGQIIDAYIYSSNCGDSDRCLLYHPRQNKDGCSCLEFCKYDYNEEAYISMYLDGFVNLSAKEDARIKFLMVWE